MKTILLCFFVNTVAVYCFSKLNRSLKMQDLSRILPYQQFQLNSEGGIGKEWSYGDLFEKSSKKLIESVSIASDSKTAIALDTQHGDLINADNFHLVKLFPENVDKLITTLVNNKVNVDIVDLPNNEVMKLFFKFSEAMINIVIYYFAISFFLNILSNLTNFPGGGANNILGPIQKKTEIVDTNNLNTTFSDVAGCDEAKFELLEVVDFLKNKEKYEEIGAKIPKGVLLEGSPGTGKTLLARAVAGEAGVPFISASGSEFIELYVGVGASRVRSLFEKAKENAPCVVFIDEIDAVGRKRGAGIAGGNDEREQTLNQILTNMDGFTSSEGVVVIAATNRIDVLDSALIRPGRFDRKVKVGLPDSKGRKKIFGVHLKNKKISDDLEIDEIVSLTTGFSGADIANLANEAAIYCVRVNGTAITRKNMMDAYEKITIGLPSSTSSPERNEKELVTYHEVGHAFLVSLFDKMFDLRKVTINENKNGAGGYTLFTPKEQFQKYASKRFILANLIIAMGGRAAEVYLYRKKHMYNKMDLDIFGDFTDLDITTGASNDIKQANELARKYITEYGFGENLCYIQNEESNETPFFPNDINKNKKSVSDNKNCDIDKQTEYLVNFAYEKALQIINDNSEVFEKIVNILMEKQVISGNEVKNIKDS